jgi:hypothetical protein
MNLDPCSRRTVVSRPSDVWLAFRGEARPGLDYFVAANVVPVGVGAAGAGVIFAEGAGTGRDADAAAARAMGILSFWCGWSGPLNLLSCRKYFAGTL